MQEARAGAERYIEQELHGDLSRATSPTLNRHEEALATHEEALALTAREQPAMDAFFAELSALES